jgi:hypothetical protein
MNPAALLVASALLAGAQPIALHPQNPHYFLYRGQPLALITSAEHYGSVINADFDYKRYLATLAADGLNYTRIFGGSYVEIPVKSFGIKRNTLAPAPGSFIAPWARSAEPGYDGGGNKFDLDHWNPAYFDRMQDFLKEASERGIIVEITLFSSHYQEQHWKRSPFHPSNNVNATAAIDWKKLHTLDNANILGYQERYTRKLVHEAAAYDNVIFEIQNEPWSDRTQLAGAVNPYLPEPARDRYPNSIDIADPQSIAWQARVAGWIRSEAKTHLIAQNCCNFGFPVRDYAPEASIINFHYPHPMAAHLNYGLGLALACDETGFRGTGDAFYLRQAWTFMLSGGGIFNNLDYSFSPGHEDGADTEPNGPGGGSAALRRQLGVLSKFLKSFDLANLRLDTNTIKHAAGAYSYTLSAPGRQYAIFIDGKGIIPITLDLPKGHYAGEWINPQTGAIERTEINGGPITLKTPDIQDGIALRLTRKN